MKKKKRKLDWNKSIEEHPHQETASEEMFSLVPPQMRNGFYAAAGIFGLFQNDINAESARVLRCPKCHHCTLRRLNISQKKSSLNSNWRCSRCGNDSDEFGNKL